MKISKILGYAALIAWSFAALHGAAQPSLAQTLRNIGATPLGLAPGTAFFNGADNIRQFATMLSKHKKFAPAIEEYARTNNLIAPRVTSTPLANTLREIGATLQVRQDVERLGYQAIKDSATLKVFAQEYQKIRGDLANNIWNGASFQRESVETPRSSRRPGAFFDIYSQGNNQWYPPVQDSEIPPLEPHVQQTIEENGRIYILGDSFIAKPGNVINFFVQKRDAILAIAAAIDAQTKMLNNAKIWARIKESYDISSGTLPGGYESKTLDAIAQEWGFRHGISDMPPETAALFRCLYCLILFIMPSQGLKEGEAGPAVMPPTIARMLNNCIEANNLNCRGTYAAGNLERFLGSAGAQNVQQLLKEYASATLRRSAKAEPICFLPEGTPPARSTPAQQSPLLPSPSTIPSASPKFSQPSPTIIPKPLPIPWSSPTPTPMRPTPPVQSLSVPSPSTIPSAAPKVPTKIPMRSPQPHSMPPAPSSISSSTSSRTHTVKPPLDLHDFISNIERYDTEIKNYQNRPMVKTYIMNSVPQRSVVFFLPSDFWLPPKATSRAALTRLVQVVVAELLNANKITSSITEEDKKIIATTLGFVCCGLDEHKSLETALQIHMGSSLLGQQAVKPTPASSSSSALVERVVPEDVHNQEALRALNTSENLILLDAQRDDIEKFSEGQPDEIIAFYEAMVQRADNPYILLLQTFFENLNINQLVLGHGKAGAQSVRMLALIAVVATHQTQSPRTQEMITSQDFVTACANNFEALLRAVLAGSSCAEAVQKVFPSLTGI